MYHPCLSWQFNKRFEKSSYKIVNPTNKMQKLSTGNYENNAIIKRMSQKPNYNEFAILDL